MKAPLLIINSIVAFWAASSWGQTILFDFENAPLYSPLPVSLTVGAATARFSATGQGFSIQAANVLGFTPAGFSGHCIYPSSVYATDLIIDFSMQLTNFSILYAPEEYACDSSATVRATAYLDGAYVGTTTTNAQAGTWPSQTLALSSTTNFNRVVVHYDAPPVTGGDYGPVFMADNMAVTVGPQPPPAPALQISRIANQITLSWPTNAIGFNLQVNTNSPDINSWNTVTNTPATVGADCTLTVPIGTVNSFYRLKWP
jgi:hypothetical protein